MTGLLFSCHQAKKVAQQQEQVRKVIEEVWAQKSLPGETDILHAPSFTMSLSNIAVDDLPGMTFQADAEPTTTPQTDAVAPTVTFTGQTTEDMFTKNQTVSGDHVSISVCSRYFISIGFRGDNAKLKTL